MGADVLGLLIFVRQFARNCDNGRRRSRDFPDVLGDIYPPEPSGSSPSSAILR
jgi:hypothetical protein